jgi:hypothetical protein
LASAPPSQIAVQVELDAPSECPNADALLERVLTRVPHARRASAAEPARRYRATIQRDGERYLGAVVSESHSATDERGSQSASCDELVTLLAVSVALSLENAEPASAPPEPAVEAPKGIRPAESASETGVSWGVLLSARVLTASVPALGGGSFEAGLESRTPGSFSPSVWLGALGLFPMAESDSVELTLLAGSLSICPARWAAGPLHVIPCLQTLAGSLSGEAREGFGAREASLLFGATGPALRLDARAAPLVVSLSAAALGVWSAPSFRSEPSGRELAAAEALAVSGGAAIGVIF